MLRSSFCSRVGAECTVGCPRVQVTVRRLAIALHRARGVGSTFVRDPDSLGVRRDRHTRGRPGRDVVYVVAKAPRAGQSKTRLCPPLLPDQAAQLAAAFLADTMTAAARAEVDVRLMCRDAAEREALLPYASGRASVHVQQGRGLGAALESAFIRGLRDGYRSVGVLGMDSPSLPPEVLARAFACLHDGADIVMGPSEDGGYYLLAARRTYPTLFRDVEWSTSDVARETLARCSALGLRTHLVDRWQDVDDAAALRALRRQIEMADPRVAPATRTALRQLGDWV